MLNSQRLNIAHAAGRIAHFSSRPSWRKSQRARWHSRPGQPGRAERKRPQIFDYQTVRILRLLLYVMSLPLLLLILYWLWPDDKPTPMLVIGVSDYQAPRPLNAFAKDDVVRFSKTLGSSYKNIRLAVRKAPENSTDLLREIEKYLESVVQPGGPNENVVLIYLSLHGAVNKAGKACLLLPGDDPLDCDTWLPISELFKTLTTVDKAKKWKKVLMLDAGRMGDCWEMGILRNTFAIVLQNELKRQPPLNCFVISATSGLDVALTAAELGGTLFGYYIADGLRGAADGAVNGKKNRQVSLQELKTYVCRQVDRWADKNRGIYQRPFFFARADEDLEELAVAHVAGKVNLLSGSWKLPVGIEKVEGCVNQVLKLCGREVWRLDPLGWARVQFLLQRLDAELLGGVAYEDDAQATLQNLEETVNHLSDETIYPPFAPASLAMQRRLDGDFKPGALTDVRNAWDQYLKKPQEAKVPQDYGRATSFTWNRLVRLEDSTEPLGHKEIADTLDFCDAAGQAPALERIEIALLRLLNRHVDWKSDDIKQWGNRPLLRRLIQARQRSESLAAPVDPRQHYLIASPLAQVDRQLADALDQVLVGSENSLRQANQRIEDTLGDGQSSYRRVDKMSEQALRALRLRDQSLASSLQLVRWLVRNEKLDTRRRENRGNTQHDELDRVNHLIDQTHQLAKEIDRLIQQSASPPNGMVDEEGLEELTDTVDRSLSSLLDAYRDRTDKLLDEGGSKTDKEVERPLHLQSPITIDENYCALRREWFKQWSGKSEQAAGGSPSGDNRQGNSPPVDKQKRVDEQEDVKKYLCWLTGKAVPPLARLFNWVGDDESDEQAGKGLAGGLALGDVDDRMPLAEIVNKLAALGGNIRQRLREAGTRCDELSAQTDALLKENPTAVARNALSRADGLSRCLAPLLTQPRWVKPEHNPAKKLRKLDAHTLLVWRGRRLLDDFWGEWKRSSERYFQTATQHLQRQLSKLDHDANFDTTSLDERLNRAGLLLSSGVWKDPLQVNDLPLDHTDPYIGHQVAFVTNGETPPGSLAIYLSERSGDVFRTYDQNHDAHRRWSLPISSGVAAGDAVWSIDLQLKAGELRQWGKTTVLIANSLFRGHSWQTRFTIGRGQIYEWEQPPPAPATVVVDGDSKLISNLIIIFDCSWSMGDRIRPNSPRRIDLGKTALIKILNQLAMRGGQYRVGLMFYGRRAGWLNNDFIVKHIDSTDYAGHPGADVEVAVPPKFLNKVHLRTIEQWLAQAKHYGETPLFFALSNALTKIQPNQGEETRILAITDGVNWQTAENGVTVNSKQQVPAPILTTRQNVIKALKINPTQIDVIEFGGKEKYRNDKEEARWKNGRDAIKEITAASGGSSYKVNDTEKDPVNELVKILQESLQLRKYHLEPSPRNQGPFDLGEIASLPPPARPTDYEVHLTGRGPEPARVWVEGGEKLKLIYNRRDKRFEYPYFNENLRGNPLDSAKGFSVATHLPRLHGDDPVFRISVQAQDKTKFPRRPEVVWAKIRPAGGSAIHTYYVIDRLFEPLLPVPMLQFSTPDWPRSKPARIELCLAMRRNDLNPEFIQVPDPVEDLLDKNGKKDKKVGAASLVIHSERDTAEAFHVVVDEKHETDGNSFPLHLQIDPPPDTIRRVFFESERKARHVFRYQTKPSKSPRVHVLTRQQIVEKGAGPFVFENVDVPRY